MAGHDSVRPFHCGTQAVDWVAANCERSALSVWTKHEGAPASCEIELALGLAWWRDGSVPAVIGSRMGYAPLALLWACPEMVPVQE